MTAEQLFRAIGYLDDALLEEAEAAPAMPRSSRLVWLRYAAVAACLSLAVYLGGNWLGLFLQATPQNNMSLQQDGGSAQYGASPEAEAFMDENAADSAARDKTATDRELPMLILGGSNTGAYGFEGYMAYDIDALVSANPWQAGSSPQALPVYRSTAAPDAEGIVPKPDFAAMQAVLLDIAGRLGYQPADIIIQDDYPNEETIRIVTEKYAATGDTVPPEFFAAGMVYWEQNGIRIEVESNLTTTIHLEPAVTLPEGYDFTHFASYENKAKVAQYLLAEYATLLDMEEPMLALEGGDQNIYGQRSFDIAFYEGAGDATQQLLHYFFNQVQFHCDDEGKLFIIRLYNKDLSQKLGDYPIITPEEALQLAEDGHYVTSAPEAYPGSALVAKTELVYRNGREETYLPYYRLYAELPTMESDNGVKTYAAYYVPAVQGQYIQNMPLWDGSFN